MPTILRTRAFWAYFGFFILAYVAFLLILLPAAYLVPSQSADPRQWQSGQVKGTVWQGRMSWAKWQRLSARNIQWQFNPWGLLRGAWEYRVSLSLNDFPINGKLAKSWWGGWHIADVVTRTRLEDNPYISEQLNAVLPDELTGNLTFRLDQLILVDQWPETVQGHLALQNLAIDGLPSLGSWEGPVNQEEDQIVWSFTIQDPALQGMGQWSLSPSLHWLFSLEVKQGETRDEALAAWLSLLGRPNAEDYRRIQQGGRLKL